MKSGRKRTNLGADAEARIALGAKRGETAEQVSVALGGATSRATVSRRLRELRGPTKATRTSKVGKSASKKTAPPSVPSSPDDIPDDADLPTLYALLDVTKKALTKAEQDENFVALGQMIRVGAALAETIRKATPPKQADPNDAPDMVALRLSATKKWHEMIDLVADG